MRKMLCGIALAFAFVGATPAMAQLPGLEIEPYIGAYVPLRNIVEESLTIPGFGTADQTAQQKEALALGGRVTVWLAGPIGVEGNFMYAFSDAELDDGTEVSDTSAYVWAADARVVFRLGVPLAPISFHINGGIALIGRGGDAYEDVTAGTSDVGGVVGVGTRIKLPGIFAIRADADGFFYSSQLTVDDPDLGGEFAFDSQFQADLVLSAGLVIGLGL